MFLLKSVKRNGEIEKILFQSAIFQPSQVSECWESVIQLLFRWLTAHSAKFQSRSDSLYCLLLCLVEVIYFSVAFGRQRAIKGGPHVAFLLQFLTMFENENECIN